MTSVEDIDHDVLAALACTVGALKSTKRPIRDRGPLDPDSEVAVYDAVARLALYDPNQQSVAVGAVLSDDGTSWSSTSRRMAAYHP